MKSDRISRRALIRGAVASVGLLTAERAVTRAAGQGLQVTPKKQPRWDRPPTVSPNNLSLTAAPGRVSLDKQTASTALTYNGFFPGPTIVARTGDMATIQFSNALAEETTVHWHGMIVPTVADGHPRDMVMPGENYLYQFPIVQRACMNWYHPHPHMLTGKQVCLGLAGAFLIRDTEEDALNLPTGLYEIPLIIRDASVDGAGNLAYTFAHSGFFGQFPLVNGKRNLVFPVNTAVYRLRVLNGCNARVFRLALSSGDPLNVIGNDGGLLATSVQASEITLGPAERLDLLVDFRQKPLGSNIVLRCLNASWDLTTFKVSSQTNPGYTLPTGTLSSITPLSNPVLTRTFTFNGMDRINGVTYDMERIDFQVPFGQTERWRFTAVGNGGPHPVHVHGASFQVQSRTGGRATVYPWERGWKDTVLLQNGEIVDVLVRFDHYRGLYILHCHNLEHEDMGMMANFEVV